jgi:hypothetical protein
MKSSPSRDLRIIKVLNICACNIFPERTQERPLHGLVVAQQHTPGFSPVAATKHTFARLSRPPGSCRKSSSSI